MKFDPSLRHHYLVDEARKLGTTFTTRQKAEMLANKYGVGLSLAIKAVEWANYRFPSSKG